MRTGRGVLSMEMMVIERGMTIVLGGFMSLFGCLRCATMYASFCLKVEELSEDESMGYAEDDWCMLQVKGHGRKVADDLEPKSDTDSQNEDDE